MKKLFKIFIFFKQYAKKILKKSDKNYFYITIFKIQIKNMKKTNKILLITLNLGLLLCTPSCFWMNLKEKSPENKSSQSEKLNKGVNIVLEPVSPQTETF